MKSSNPVAISMLEKFDDSKRAVANLMARENITCQVVDGAVTAQFNPQTRVLIVPNWTGLTTEQCDLLMSHEIGHALFTDRKIEVRKISPGLFTYLNIIEDARIERRMKGAFPGLAPTFYKGYREFHANGPILKGTKDSLINPKSGAAVPVAGMKLIDRINLHYKIGAFITVPFSEAERVWLARIDKATSTEECLQIARDMHREQKEQDKPESNEPKNNPSNDKQKKSPKQEETEESDSQDSDDQDSTEGESQDGDENESDSNESDGDESDDESKSGKSGDDSDDDEEGDESDTDGDESDEDGDDDESDSDSDGGESDETDAEETDKSAAGDNDPAAETDTAEALKDLASKGDDPRNTIVNIVYPVLSDDDLKGRTISAHEFTKGAYDALTKANAPASDLDALESAWNAQFLATAKHMALEFERRKQAKQLLAATTGKSGKLDLTKLAQYRFTDDLFKRTMVVPNGKSHGIVMLIDGSGSMSGQFKDVIDQVLLFAQFAFIVNIPFEAYMFSDNCDWNGDGHFEFRSTGLNALTLNETGRLIGLVNTTTDRANFKRNVRALLAVRAQYDRYNTKLSTETWNGISKIPHSCLSGTPLFCGIMIAERHVARMKQTQKLDKTTFVVITDGEDTNGLYYEAMPNAQNSWRRNENFEYLSGAFVVRDAVTKKNLPYVETSTYAGQTITRELHNAQLTMLLDIIKLRHDTRTIYIYLQENGGYSYRPRRRRFSRPTVSVQGFEYLVRAGKNDEASRVDKVTVAATMKKDGQYVLPVSIAVADLAIILPVNSVRLTENEFSKMDTDDMTQKKIAAEFTKSMVKAVANRKFVNSTIPHLI